MMRLLSYCPIVILRSSYELRTANKLRLSLIYARPAPRGKTMIKLLSGLLLVLCTAAAAGAQPAPVCAPPALLSLARAGSACYNTANNEACYGGGVVSTEIFDGGTPLNQPGDRADVNGLQRVSVAPA